MPEPFRLAFIGVDHPHGAGWRQSLQCIEPDIEIVSLVPGFGGTTASLEERYSSLPRNGVQASWDLLKLLDAIYRSAEEGRRVEV